jgi:cutinase
VRSIRMLVILAALLSVLGGLEWVAGVPASNADPCTDIHVVFARGTSGSPGISQVGQSFVDTLRTQIGDRTMSVYAVNYPGSLDFGPSATAGAQDSLAHIEQTVQACPSTKIVLGGYSQGADVVGLLTAPTGTAWGEPSLLPPDVADHVAAVVLFGNPSRKFGGGPLNAISPAFGPKTIDLCVPGDLVCSTEGVSLYGHGLYISSGATGQAAAFAASHL